MFLEGVAYKGKREEAQNNIRECSRPPKGESDLNPKSFC